MGGVRQRIDGDVGTVIGAVPASPRRGRQVQEVDVRGAIHHEFVAVGGSVQIVQVFEEIRGHEGPQLVHLAGDQVDVGIGLAGGVGPDRVDLGRLAEGLQPPLVGAHQDDPEPVPSGEAQLGARRQGDVGERVGQVRRGRIDDVAHDVGPVGQARRGVGRIQRVGAHEELDQALLVGSPGGVIGRVVLGYIIQQEVAGGRSRIGEGRQGGNRRVRTGEPGIELPGVPAAVGEEGIVARPYGGGRIQGRGRVPGLVEDDGIAVGIGGGREHEQVAGPHHASVLGRLELAEQDLLAEGRPDEGQVGVGGHIDLGGVDRGLEGVVEVLGNGVGVGPIEIVDGPRDASAAAGIEGRVPLEGRELGDVRVGIHGRVPQGRRQEEVPLGADAPGGRRGRGAPEADAHGHGGDRVVMVRTRCRSFDGWRRG